MKATHLKSSKGFPLLLVSLFQVAFADNAAKLMLISVASLAFAHASGGTPWQASLIAALMVLPYIVFAPFAGWVADSNSKRTVLIWTLVLQLGAIAVVAAGLLYQSFPLGALGFGLLALQSAFFSPAKQGIIKELVPADRIAHASGWMEMLTVAAILTGGFAGGKLFDWALDASASDIWLAGGCVMLLLSVTAIASWLVIQPLTRTPVQSNEPFSPGMFTAHFRYLRLLWANRETRYPALGMTYFYTLGGIVYLTLIQTGFELRGAAGAASLSGFYMLLLGAGICVGSLIAAKLCRHSIEFGLASAGGAGLFLALLVLALVTPGSLAFQAGLVALGISGGFLVVPMQAAVISNAPDSIRARILASTNLLINLGGLSAVGFQALLGGYWKWHSQTVFITLATVALLAFFFILRLTPRATIKLIASAMVRIFYRLRVRGVERIPQQGGALLVANHLSYVDVVLLAVTCPRPFRIMGFEGLQKSRWMRRVFQIFDVIPVSKHHAKDALNAAAEALKAGHIVCIFPEGQISRTGQLLELNRGYEVLAHRANVPVIPVGLDGLWGSVFSFHGDRYFWKRPQAFPYPVQIEYGTPIAAGEVHPGVVRQALLDLLAAGFANRACLNDNLGHRALCSMAKHPSRTAMIDYAQGRKAYSNATITTAALALASEYRRTIEGKRAGIVLPPGAAGWLANLAVSWAGKTPVNLNFTLGAESINTSLQSARIDTIITTTLLQKKLPKFPWTADTRLIESSLTAISPLRKAILFSAVLLLPGRLLARIAGISTHGGQAEAGLLFSSGSTGQPKGVILTHQNILANIEQIAAVRLLEPNDRLLGALPLFHSFGFSGTFWMPLINQLPVIACPSPLDYRKIAQAIQAEGATLMVNTPTFLRPFLSKVDPAALHTLRLVIAGAEKTPDGFATAWETRFGGSYLEGYGLTETSPCLSLNLPHPARPTPLYTAQTGSRAGSTGRLLPGISIRIIDPVSGASLPLHESGLLLVRGANVISGYLENHEASAMAFRDGWFVTGDLARLDEDGYLKIEGRLSRFSKIGGEMVPHGYVEEKIAEVLGVISAEKPLFAVTGIPDQQKGEALVLIASVPIPLEVIREKLAATGISNLWIPRQLRRVENIPCLATGKLDLHTLRKLAIEDAVTANA